MRKALSNKIYNSSLMGDQLRGLGNPPTSNNANTTLDTNNQNTNVDGEKEKILDGYKKMKARGNLGFENVDKIDLFNLLLKEKALERFKENNALDYPKSEWDKKLKGKALILETFVETLPLECIQFIYFGNDLKTEEDILAAKKKCEDSLQKVDQALVKKIFDAIPATQDQAKAYEEFIKAYNTYINEINTQKNLKLSTIQDSESLKQTFNIIFEEVKEQFKKLLIHNRRYDNENLKKQIEEALEWQNISLLDSGDTSKGRLFINPKIYDMLVIYPAQYLIYGLALNAIDGVKVSNEKMSSIKPSTKIAFGVGVVSLALLAGGVYYYSKKSSKDK